MPFVGVSSRVSACAELLGVKMGFCGFSASVAAVWPHGHEYLVLVASDGGAFRLDGGYLSARAGEGSQ